MIVLVTGGTRSGKSRIAEALAADLGDDAVTYLATAIPDAGDTDHQGRIAAHRMRRPDGWTTVECRAPHHLAAGLRDTDRVALVDSIGTWLTLHHDLEVTGDEVPELLATLRDRDAATVLVTEEVGLAIHPPDALSRRYVDALGLVNQQLAEVADRVLLVVAGRVLELPPS
jgi:adenosyl cobinamide kinase/adenosyl cobinamide phosphate guanylyltransferase